MSVHHPGRREFMKIALKSSLLASSFSIVDASTLLGIEPATADPQVADSPYGVCAHLLFGEEWDQQPKNLQMMKDAGIRWVRSDFSWSALEKPQGQWNFERFDKVVERTNEMGLQILPILDYDVPWGAPAFEHLDEWLAYVRTAVKRYHDRIRYWEVWNEENADGFWHAKANGADYTTLLKATYKAIKEIDPELVVLYGGLAGVPCDFFEASLDAGAGEFFDAINIHPYRGGLITIERVQQFSQQIEQFREALRKRNLPPKPVWITEMGWATPPTYGEVDQRIMSAALQKLFPNATPKIALFYDERFDPSTTFPYEDFLLLLPEIYRQDKTLTRTFNADELPTIGETDVDILIMPPSETFPADRLSVMVDYVKNGGVLVLLGGAPLYYESWIDDTGLYVQGPHNPHFARDLDSLRISWFAWWTREHVPEMCRAEPAPETFDLQTPEGRALYEQFRSTYDAHRYFDDLKMREGDKMIPLVNAVKDDFKAASACIYDFNSDYKGAVVVSGLYCATGANSNTSTVKDQAVYLTQAILLSLAFDVEKYFWYEFHAPERDRSDKEHHFGIVGQNLDPKPAYFAYKTLTQARPAGSSEDALKVTKHYCVVSWKRPDGKKGWALWALSANRKVALKIDGAVEEAYDYLGNNVALPSDNKQIELTSGALFLIGPENVDIQ